MVLVGFCLGQNLRKHKATKVMSVPPRSSAGTMIISSSCAFITGKEQDKCVCQCPLQEELIGFKSDGWAEGPSSLRLCSRPVFSISSVRMLAVKQTPLLTCWQQLLSLTLHRRPYSYVLICWLIAYQHFTTLSYVRDAPGYVWVTLLLSCRAAIVLRRCQHSLVRQ